MFVVRYKPEFMKHLNELDGKKFYKVMGSTKII